MTPLRDYLRGLRSQADVARELGISVRQLQRIEDEAVARWLLGLSRAMREVIGDDAPPPIACRISEDVPDDHEHAPHVVSPRRFSGGTPRRAGLPRRFKP